MRCPACGTLNSAGLARCTTCRTPLEDSDSGETQTVIFENSPGGQFERPTAPLLGESHWSDEGLRPAAGGNLVPGSTLGKRYEIIRPLGKGGMGSVYEARDCELDRLVALKVIRPELVGDPKILSRFRQEVVLARQVTHPNIVRIFDLGIIGGLRFISMEFIDGRQLSSVLEEKGKLPPREAAEIILQVCRGLAAAHERGIVHRDLKPPNVMIDKDGRVVVMDFGIARAGGESARSAPAESGMGLGAAPLMTQAGALIGTPLYMSPEQAKGEPVDARSDLFTVGIITYELVTGDLPFLGRSAAESLRKRCEEKPVPPVLLNPQLPRAVNEIILKCLETSPEDRYQTTGELIRALERFLGIGKTAHRGKWAAGSLAASLVLSGAFIGYQQHAAKKAAPHPPVKVLIADLKNNTADPVFSGSLEPLLSIALEGAPFISSYNRVDAHKIAAQLRPGSTVLDASLARLVALREGINVVISGTVSLADGKYRVSLAAVDSAKGTPIKAREVTVVRKQDLLASVGTLAASIRTALGDASSDASKLAAAETFSSASLEAAQRYAQAQDLKARGKWDDAIELYRQTVQLDPNFGRAYAGLGALFANLGRREEARKNYELALQKLDRMSDREKFRTRGGYFLFMREDQQALAEFKSLVAAYPADTSGISNLALTYFYERDMPDALREGREAARSDPNSALYRSNEALYALYAGDYRTAIAESREILKTDPDFSKALLCVALAQLGEGQTAEASKSWGAWAAMGRRGASAAALGLADLALYQGRYGDVIRMLPQAIASDVKDQNLSASALKRIALAQAYLAAGRKSQAAAAAEAAWKERQDPPVAFPAAQIFLDAGEERRAAPIAADLDHSFDPDSRAYAAIIRGLIQLRQGQRPEALSSLQNAQKLADTWLGRLALGRAYVEVGAFPEADAELDNCVKRQGEASAVFLDDEPSFRYLPAAYYYRAKAREGLRMSSAGDDYRTFLQFKASSEADPMVMDARRRLTRR